MSNLFFLLLASLYLRAATIYQVNRVVRAGSVVGTITTDDNIGVISGSNITAWSWTINNGVTSAQLSNSLANHSVVVTGIPLSAAATQRLFNFNEQPGSYAFFRDNNTNTFWCIQTSACTGPTPGEAVRVPNNDAAAAQSGTVIIASTVGAAPTSNVPEPGTFYLLALSESLLVLLRRSRYPTEIGRRSPALQ